MGVEKEVWGEGASGRGEEEGEGEKREKFPETNQESALGTSPNPPPELAANDVKGLSHTHSWCLPSPL